jgi:hypothetical protein
MWIGGYAQPGFVRLILSAALCLHRRQLHRLRPQFVALWITVLGLQGMAPVWADCGSTAASPDDVLSITYHPIVRSDLRDNFTDLTVHHHCPEIIKGEEDHTVKFSHLPSLSVKSDQRKEANRISSPEQQNLTQLFRHFLLPESLYDDRDLLLGYGQQAIESATKTISQVTYPLYPVQPSWNKPTTIDLVIDVSGSSPFKPRNNGAQEFKAIELLYQGIKKRLLENDTLRLYVLATNLVLLQSSKELDKVELSKAIKKADPRPTFVSRLFKGLPSVDNKQHQVIILVTDGEPDESDTPPAPKRQENKEKKDWKPEIGEWLDKRANWATSTSHVFLVVTRLRNKPEDQPQQRAKDLREYLLLDNPLDPSRSYPFPKMKTSMTKLLLTASPSSSPPV